MAAVRHLGARARMLLAAFVLAAVMSLVAPVAASADVTDMVPDFLESVVRWVFGGVQTDVTLGLVTWLTQIPNFQPIAPVGPPSSYAEFLDSGAPVATASKGHLNELRVFTTMMSLGLLGAVMTLAVIRYWLAGLSISGSGGIEAVEGFARCLLAVALILIWPEAFTLLIALANTASTALLELPALEKNLEALWAFTTVASFNPVTVPVAPFVVIIVFVAFIVMMLALIAMKVLVTAGLALLYVAMPILLVLRPLPEASWMARAAGRAFFVCLMVPFTWTLIFCAFAALGMDSLLADGPSGGFFDDAIIKPLATVAMLGLAIQLPRQMGRAAMLGAVGEVGGRGGGGGGGMVGRTASYLMARRFDSMLSSHLPEALGGQREQVAGRAAARAPKAAKLAGGAGAAATNSPGVQAAWQKAFGGSTFRADDTAFAAVRQPAHKAFVGNVNAMKPSASMPNATRRALATKARAALDQLSPEQRVALAASIRDNPAGFAWNTANSSLDPSLTSVERDALYTLGEMPRETLQDAFTQQEWDDGGAMAQIKQQPSSSGASTTQTQAQPVPPMPTTQAQPPTQTQTPTPVTQPMPAPAAQPTQTPTNPAPARTVTATPATANIPKNVRPPSPPAGVPTQPATPPRWTAGPAGKRKGNPRRKRT